MRLIDADALKRRAQKAATEAWKMKLTARVETTLNQFLDWINQAPTIEPERKKGEWIEQDDGWDGVYYECSVCKEAFTLIDGTPSDNLYNYCPNCGAYMKCEPNED